MKYYIQLNPIDFTVVRYSPIRGKLAGASCSDYAMMYIDDCTDRFVEFLYNIANRIDQGDTKVDPKWMSVIVADKLLSAGELKGMQVYPYLSKDDIKKLRARIDEKFEQALAKKKKFLADTPYLTRHELIIHKLYNPKYGDDRVCECGHPYYRHFDTYDQMAAVGCKYCQCLTFTERTEQVNQKDLADQYIKKVKRQNEYQMERFANGEEGWYDGFYYKMMGGKMTVVDSINGDNSLNYPD